MNYKTTVRVDVPATSSYNLTIDTSTSGWIGVIQFHYSADVTGNVGLQQRRQDDEGNWETMVIATGALSTEADAVWNGSQFFNTGDILRINNECASAASVYITILYEPFGAGTWQEFAAGAADESSSSSSEEYSSSSSSTSNSSSSSSSQEYSSSSSSS